MYPPWITRSLTIIFLRLSSLHALFGSNSSGSPHHQPHQTLHSTPKSSNAHTYNINRKYAHRGHNAPRNGKKTHSSSSRTLSHTHISHQNREPPSVRPFNTNRARCRSPTTRIPQITNTYSATQRISFMNNLFKSLAILRSVYTANRARQ